MSALFERQAGVATTAQLLHLMSRRQLQQLRNAAVLEHIWRGVYSLGPADITTRLRALDLTSGTDVAICLNTAARAWGFDTENRSDLHVLNPEGHQLRPVPGLVVHRRDGAPLRRVAGRLTTAPAWTAVEVARALPRPRSLATLDAALRSGQCNRAGLSNAVTAQTGRRGIVRVRELLTFADGRAESPMESEARLVMIDGALPTPALQYEVRDAGGRLRRLDFAWPDQMVAAEYDSDQWHAGTDALRRDREKVAALQDLGWIVVPIVRDDVRRRQHALVNRIRAHLDRASAA